MKMTKKKKIRKKCILDVLCDVSGSPKTVWWVRLGNRNRTELCVTMCTCVNTKKR